MPPVIFPREIEAMQVAYNALRGQDASVERRMLTWLTDRLAEDARGREAEEHAGPAPSCWCANGDPTDVLPMADRGEAIEEADADHWSVVEVCGLAIVKQEFVVMVHTDEGREHKSFPTRAEADAYVKGMLADEPVNLDGREIPLQPIIDPTVAQLCGKCGHSMIKDQSCDHWDTRCPLAGFVFNLPF